MYKNSENPHAGEYRKQEEKNKHRFPQQGDKLLSPLGFILFLLPDFSLSWALDTHVEDTLCP